MTSINDNPSAVDTLNATARIYRLIRRFENVVMTNAAAVTPSIAAATDAVALLTQYLGEGMDQAVARHDAHQEAAE
jgi:hypothetical protein